MGVFKVGCLIKNQVDREKSVKIPRLMVDTGSDATGFHGSFWNRSKSKWRNVGHIRWRMANMFIVTSATPLFALDQRETVDEVVFAEQGDFLLAGAARLGRFVALG
jgi:hypothetical protein